MKENIEQMIDFGCCMSVNFEHFTEQLNKDSCDYKLLERL